MQLVEQLFHKNHTTMLKAACARRVLLMSFETRRVGAEFILDFTFEFREAAGGNLSNGIFPSS